MPLLLVKHSIDRVLVHSLACSYFRTYSLAVEILTIAKGMACGEAVGY